MSFLFLRILILVMAAMSLAVLFVYSPKRLKTLPWIVLAIMELAFLVMGLVEIHSVLLWECDGTGAYISSPGWFWLGKLNFHGRTQLIVSAIPILALWVMLIVDAVQKKKKAS